MSEIMLHDVATAHGMSYRRAALLRTWRAPTQARVGLATVGATHLLKIAVEAATGQRAKVDVFGTDYPTPTAVASAISSTSATSRRRIARRCPICATAASRRR
jgi:UDP-glucose 4-epimerase